MKNYLFSKTNVSIFKWLHRVNIKKASFNIENIFLLKEALSKLAQLIAFNKIHIHNKFCSLKLLQIKILERQGRVHQ